MGNRFDVAVPQGTELEKAQARSCAHWRARLPSGFYHAEDIGTHYARTLAAWRKRFHDSADEVRALGFDDRFIRMWDNYLAYSEGAFLERHIGDIQLLPTKNHSPRKLFSEPWGEEGMRD